LGRFGKYAVLLGMGLLVLLPAQAEAAIITWDGGGTDGACGGAGTAANWSCELTMQAVGG